MIEPCAERDPSPEVAALSRSVHSPLELRPFTGWGSTIDWCPSSPPTRFPAGVPMMFDAPRAATPPNQSPGIPMPNIASVLKAEIARLARKEIRAELAA